MAAPTSVLAVTGALSTGGPGNDTNVYGFGGVPATAIPLASAGMNLPTVASGGFVTPTVPVHVSADGQANFYVNGMWINGLTGNPATL